MEKKSNNKTKIIIIIIILVVLLFISLCTLIFIHTKIICNKPISIVVSEHIINSESNIISDNSIPSDKETFGTHTNSTSSSETTSSTDIEGSDTTSSTYTDDPEIFEPPLNVGIQHHKDNAPFEVTNMFPGDRETKYYCINISHNDTIEVYFHANIKKGYEKLAEVLKIKVALKDKDEILYDGLMKDMPEDIKHILDTEESITNKVYYEITAYLDTDVGNEYMGEKLKADFKWWVEEADNLDS